MRLNANKLHPTMAATGDCGIIMPVGFVVAGLQPPALVAVKENSRLVRGNGSHGRI
jgi:hypothetical protein